MKEYFDQIRQIVDSTLLDSEKAASLDQFHDSDIASVLEDLSKEERLSLYSILGIEKTSSVFSYLTNVEDYIEELNNHEYAADLIEHMDADDAIDVLEELDDVDAEKIKAYMSEDIIEDIDMITNYDDDAIGSHITTNYIEIDLSYTIKSAMKYLISEAAEKSNFSTIFVNDLNGKYYGSIELRDLISARSDADLNDIVKTAYPYIFATEKVSDCITRLKDLALELVPVLDDNFVLIGVITSSDIIESVNEELSEDYAKFAGLTSSEDINESIFKSLKKRIPWLVILLVMGLLEAYLISNFEGIVRSVPVIVFFQTLVLGMSGNVGTQSLAVTIRLLVNKNITGKILLKAVFKEVRVGFINGLILGTLAFAIIFAFLFILKLPVTTDYFILNDSLKISASIATALLVTMTTCSLFATAVPILFSKIKVDPAVASGPFITTMNDVTAIVIYYSIGYMLLVATL